MFEKPQTLMGFSLCSTMWEENTPETLKAGQTHAEVAAVAVLISIGLSSAPISESLQETLSSSATSFALSVNSKTAVFTSVGVANAITPVSPSKLSTSPDFKASPDTIVNMSASYLTIIPADFTFGAPTTVTVIVTFPPTAISDFDAVKITSTPSIGAVVSVLVSVSVSVLVSVLVSVSVSLSTFVSVLVLVLVLSSFSSLFLSLPHDARANIRTSISSIAITLFIVYSFSTLSILS